MLGSPQSPIRSLLTAVTHELTLTAPQPAAAAANPVKTVAAASSAAAELQRVLGGPAPGVAVPDGHEIDARYKALRDYVGQGPGAPIDQALAAINGLQQNLAQLASAPADGSAGATAGGPDPMLTLRAVASQAPQPVQRWLLALASNGAALRAGGARQQAAAAFNGAGGPAQLCAAGGRRPLSLRCIGNQRCAAWRFRPAVCAGRPDRRLLQRSAQAFRRYRRPCVEGAGGGRRARARHHRRPAAVPACRARSGRCSSPPVATMPSLRLDITPTDLDAGSKQVTLDLGGSSLTYAHGPSRATTVTWPAQGGDEARLVFDPPAPNGAIQASGPWALFHLIAQGKLQQNGAPDRFTLVFQQGERRAVFAIRMTSVVNPFSNTALQDFRCPALR